MIKKLLTIGLIAVVGTNAYYSTKLYRFAKESQEYYKWVTLKINCEEFKASEDKDAIWRLSKGYKLLPRPGGYDTHIPECLEYYNYMCWVYDESDPAQKKHCEERDKRLGIK